MSTRGSQILTNPHVTIGAQELPVVEDCARSGFLRKQGRIERTIKFLKWRQRYVVLSKGCLYIYNDEYATAPMSSAFLGNYIKCVRQRVPGRMQWIFQLVPATQATLGTSGTSHSLMFCSATEEERKEWMSAIKNELMLAHKFTEEQIAQHKLGCSDEEYIYLEKSVVAERPRALHPARNVPLPREEEEDYHEIANEQMLPDNQIQPSKRNKPTFPAPQPGAQDKGFVRQTSSPATSPLPSPTSPSAVSKTSYEYEGSDRNHIERLLVALPRGTYLVRKSRQDNKEVLSVNIDNSLKEFKIYDKDGQVTVDQTTLFPTLEKLLEYYTQNNLPKHTSSLTKPYRESADYINGM
ncbi:SH3 domain-binding protein 2-like [Mya arenaria]|uniref:SH3 domain-binding protein 2-like n=1 Tax=Mya arenaria TaxID=6604 RepID=UPI0022DF1FBA|nr:SH3 domain-binding protein 2-like [Mya arenaria]XP_052773182.1 SH3 domain-binding protein 2-like [Mya arenaria]